MVDVFSRRCLHNSCKKRTTFDVQGSNTALYCRSHAGDGFMNRKVPSLEGVSTTGPKLTNSSATARTRHTKVNLDAAANPSNSSAAVVDFRKRSWVELDDGQPPLCVDHLPFQSREGRRNTWVDSKKDDNYTPSSSPLPRLLHGYAVGTVTN